MLPTLKINFERWKWNPDFELYVSTKGHFRNRQKKEVSVTIDNRGYCRVYCGGTMHKNVSAHRVVMLTWRPVLNAAKLTVDHLDHNKRNNSLDNLEWVSQEENLRRAKADEIVVAIDGPVEKVDVKITPQGANQKTNYPYYVRLEDTVDMTIEQLAALMFAKEVTGLQPHQRNLETYTKTLADNLLSGSKKKMFGFNLILKKVG